ncbi:MAG TPA: glycosyltransferase family A protein [Thermoplasmata archaeon]|nr:glycosyltransferase family A protein [Thermoplasmata archaeon]
MNDSGLSVIIPTLGKRPSLRTLLESLAYQTPRPDEIVIVDGGNDPEVAQLARRFDCIYLHDVGKGDRRSHARNAGVTASSGQFLLFLDDDMETTSDLIRECRDIFSQGGQAITIPEVTLGHGLTGRVRAWERAQVLRRRYLCFPRGIVRRLFISCGGFDETLPGFEDLDITATLMEHNVEVLNLKAVILHHEESNTLSALLRRRLYYLRGAKTYRAKHPTLALEVFSPVARLKLYLEGIHSVADIPLFVSSVLLRAFEYFGTR